MYAKKTLKYEDASDQNYQLLGNLYNKAGDPDMAIRTYGDGLRKFPNAGRLYLEWGVVELGKEKYNDALKAFETGIGKDPEYPSNYFRSAVLFLKQTEEEVWGMLYGEVFMNLERNTARTKEMSSLLYKTYKNEITWKNDTSVSISFSNNNTIDLSKLGKNDKMKMPFGVGVYEPLMMMSAISYKKLTLETMCSLRESFLDLYFSQKKNVDYPNILFIYQRKVHKAGHLNAYNHWVLMQGDEKAFDAWYADHKTEWKAFTTWFNDNPISISAADVFVRKTTTDSCPVSVDDDLWLTHVAINSGIWAITLSLINSTLLRKVTRRCVFGPQQPQHL